MTAAEFVKIIGLIGGAYPHIDRFKDDDVKDVWFECLEDLDYDRARKATINLIKSVPDFPPDIAKIREEYNYLRDCEKSEEGSIKNYYNSACGSYPISIPSGLGWDIWQERAKTSKDADTFYSCIMQYLNSLEGDAMDFEQCLRTICRDENGKIYFKDVV